MIAADGVVLIRDANTTIGYCRYTAAGDIEYLFVHPAHRRRGVPLAPISPLGQHFFGRAAHASITSIDEAKSSR